ncbi:hypothetical protein A2316_01190 [Candidatus Falkowbacteria bacterium RIFOXYB2_FULL_38_15]|uniref:Uncharacterized protein n=1 Tax=Candidatus Falkowbacteria bacterium RIFOXYA2_FULL_38_12 TaxID=1797993 RepID=A0A1F5S4U1_9BACT|nr:MAG: hypothetical protein A2257_02590 [Candidatus Falkowbacteria bacterium RIFOXYA2_FULL_38_12]OGF32797.1 MAG: hypothetical protein A2316_01190 [Candidatus Falkowbacteria bacterium RIFOXYB2_FULL_38_15]OGF42166.1 MAG: hypothetical protein A2555_02700 [Candidatus Falkowbacteria bacterium RIFOXYD2_FULL_39_16]
MWERKKSENNNEDQQAKNAWLLIIGVFIVILAVLFFGRAYWQKQEASFIDEKQLFEQISDIKGQIAQLQENLSEKVEKPKEIERALIKAEAALTTIDCDEQANFELPDKTVTFLNQDWGISLDIPYNEKWGSTSYKLNSYDIDMYKNGAIFFGPMIIHKPGLEPNSCGWLRQYLFQMTERLTLDEELSKIKKFTKPLSPPEKKTFNDLTIIEYTVTEPIVVGQDKPLATIQTLIVLGKDANYILSKEMMPQDSSTLNFEVLENIIKSFKFLE